MINTKKHVPNWETYKCKWATEGDKSKSPHIHVPFRQPPKIAETILDAVGFTPVVKLNKIPASEGIKCQIYGKCEFLNPGGSLKDRVGVRMLLDAEKAGIIKPGDVLVEPTSGNTGIGLAMAAVVRGYELWITLPEKMSTEKEDVLKSFGATVVRCPTEAPEDSPENYVMKAYEIANSFGERGHVLQQYHNVSNPMAHYDQTGDEILNAFDKKIDYLFISAGTGGCVQGLSRRFKERSPSTVVVAMDPHGSILGPKGLNDESIGGYKIEGIGSSFKHGVLNEPEFPEWVKTYDGPSFVMARRLLKEEGLMAGGSSGSCLVGMFQYLKDKNLHNREDLTCVVILPDHAKNYTSKFLSKEWMVENGFYSEEEVIDKTHFFYKHPVQEIQDELGIRDCEYFDGRLTISECIDEFAKGTSMIPIQDRGVVVSVVKSSKFLAVCSTKKLKPSDSASKAQSKDFVKIRDTMDLSVIEKIMSRHEAIIVVKPKGIWILTRVDFIRFYKLKMDQAE